MISSDILVESTFSRTPAATLFFHSRDPTRTLPFTVLMMVSIGEHATSYIHVASDLINRANTPPRFAQEISASYEDRRLLPKARAADGNSSPEAISSSMPSMRSLILATNSSLERNIMFNCSLISPCSLLTTILCSWSLQCATAAFSETKPSRGIWYSVRAYSNFSAS